jgi:hypothetical protein
MGSLTVAAVLKGSVPVVSIDPVLCFRSTKVKTSSGSTFFGP